MCAFSILIFTVAVSSCSDDGSDDVIPLKPVVEAYLAAGDSIDVYITKEIPFSDTSSGIQTLDNLTVKIMVNGQTKTLAAQGNGHYISDFLVDSNKTYQLIFDYNGVAVTAETTIPLRPKGFTMSATSLTISNSFPPQFPDPVKLTWTNENNDYFLVVANNVETSPELIFSGFGGPDNPARRFRTRPSQASSAELMAPQFQYYGQYDVILYRINAEYVSLYDENGNNSLNLTAPYTNVKNGLGIFTGVAADTLQLTVSK